MRLATVLLPAALLTTTASARAQEPPAPPAPAPSPLLTPPGAPANGEATLRFEPDDAGISLHVRTDTAVVWDLDQRFRWVWWWRAHRVGVYSPLCLDACFKKVPNGEYQLAISKDRGLLIPVSPPVRIEGPTTLRAEYVDRSSLRTAGAVIGVGGILTGLALIVVSVTATGDHTDGAFLGGGIGLVVGSAVVGSILGLQRDEARVTATPGS